MGDRNRYVEEISLDHEVMATLRGKMGEFERVVEGLINDVVAPQLHIYEVRPPYKVIVHSVRGLHHKQTSHHVFFDVNYSVRSATNAEVAELSDIFNNTETKLKLDRKDAPWK